METAPIALILILAVLVPPVVFGALTRDVGERKGYNGSRAFIAGVFFGPFALFAYFVADWEKRTCPWCGEPNPVRRRHCRECHLRMDGKANTTYPQEP